MSLILGVGFADIGTSGWGLSYTDVWDSTDGFPGTCNNAQVPSGTTILRNGPLPPARRTHWGVEVVEELIQNPAQDQPSQTCNNAHVPRMTTILRKLRWFPWRN